MEVRTSDDNYDHANDPILADVNRRWVSENPELGSDPIPIESCYSFSQYDMEQKHLFNQVWLQVARQEEIANPGDYIVKEFPGANTSVILVRGKDKVIRGFHNICSHRCNKLCWDESGKNARGFSCKFHGWVYSLEGSLLNVPDEAMFNNFHKADHGLSTVLTEVWQGFVFINLDQNPKQDLPEFLGDFGKQIEGYPFHEMTESYYYRMEIECNWKVGMDAFSEAYHAPYLHRLSFEDALTGKHNPNCHWVDVKLYDQHRHASSVANVDYVPSPFGQWAYSLGGTSLADKDAAWEGFPPTINPHRSPYWGFNIESFFPNFNLYLNRNNYLSHQFWPISPTRSIWEGRLYFRPAKTAAEQIGIEYGRSLQIGAWLEDTATMENTQSVLASGVKTHYVLQEQEVLLRHFHKVLAESIANSSTGGRL